MFYRNLDCFFGGGLGFKGMLLLMGKMIIKSYKMKCIEFCVMYEFISVIVI